MITAATALFGVAPLVYGTQSGFPKLMGHRGVNQPRSLWLDAAPLQSFPQAPVPRMPEVGHEEEQSLQQEPAKHFWDVKLTMQGLNQNESRGLEALKCYQLVCFSKS